MLSSVLVLSCLGATLSVHVVEVKDVALDRAFEVAHVFGDALSEVSGDRAKVSDQLWSQCEDESSCARQLALGDGASLIFLLHFFQTPNMLLLIVDRMRGDGARVLTASRKLVGAREVWKAEIESLARELVGDRRDGGVPVVAATREPSVDRGPPWLLIGGGAGVAFAGAAIGFALSSASARDQLLGGARGSDIDVYIARMETHQAVANICFAGAIGAVLTGVILEVLE